jgi:uncharacterized protein (TIGR02996 family)
MSDEDALLAAIIANPDEDTPRLVYADWLDENGQPERAEFIRLQIRFASSPHERESDPDLVRREHLLLKQMERCDPAWKLTDGRGQYHRGFVFAARLHATSYARNAEKLFTLAPVRQVGIDEAERRFAEVSLVPRPRTVRVQFEMGRRHIRTWKRCTVDLLNPDLRQLEDYVLGGRWVVVVWARWQGDDRRAVEASLDYGEDLARINTKLGLRPLNLAHGMELICPTLVDPYTTPRWLLLDHGSLVDDHVGPHVPFGWLPARS